MINPEYYSNSVAFDLRQGSCKKGGKKSHFMKSAFWNPKTHMVLTSKSTEQRSNIYTNTRSFAEKNTKNSCKFKVRQTYKNESDMPQPGYYDTKKAFDKTFGEEVVNAVNMDKDLDRTDIFTGNVDPSCW